MFQREITHSQPATGAASLSWHPGEESEEQASSQSPPRLPHGPLADLIEFSESGSSLAFVGNYYAECAQASEFGQSFMGGADFRQRLADWLALSPAPGEEPPSEATVHRVSEELRSALAAALAIGLAHSAELLMVAMSNHPAVRLSAMSHPYIVGTYLESLFKELFEVSDPDPDNKTGIRFQEKVVAALANWNHVQPRLDLMAKSALSRSLKVLATAAISGLRDVAERGATRLALAELPEDAPAGQRKLTSAESFFVNCLMVWLRNAVGDLPRQVIKSQEGFTLPPVDRMVERFLRPLIAGPTAAGGLPAATICAQPLFADAVREQDGEEPPTPPSPRSPPSLLEQAYGPDCDPFST